MADGIRRDENGRDRRRAAIAAALSEVTTGPRVEIRPGVSVPARFVRGGR